MRLPYILRTLLHLSTTTGMLCDCLISYVHFYTCTQSLECCATALYLMYISTPVHNHWNVVRLSRILCTLLHLSTITGMLCYCIIFCVHFYTCPQSLECCATVSYLAYTSTPVHNHWNVVRLPYISHTLLQYTCPQSPECCVTDSLLNAYLCYASFPQSLEY